MRAALYLHASTTWASARGRYPDRQGGARRAGRRDPEGRDTIPSHCFMHSAPPPFCPADNSTEALRWGGVWRPCCLTLAGRRSERATQSARSGSARSPPCGGWSLAPLPAGRGTSCVPAAALPASTEMAPARSRDRAQHLCRRRDSIPNRCRSRSRSVTARRFRVRPVSGADWGTKTRTRIRTDENGQTRISNPVSPVESR
jgi:hypothetical protein